jgi:hypothetical protein
MADEQIRAFAAMLAHFRAELLRLMELTASVVRAVDIARRVADGYRRIAAAGASRSLQAARRPVRLDRRSCQYLVDGDLVYLPAAVRPFYR